MGYLDNDGLQRFFAGLKGIFASKDHDHDSRYYTESEVDTKLASKYDAKTNRAAGTVLAAPSASSGVAEFRKLAKSDISDFPASLKNPNKLTIQGNGTTLASYDGSSALTANITKANIGLGNVDNTADAEKNVNYAAMAGKDAEGYYFTGSYMKRRGYVKDSDADNATIEGIYQYGGELTNFYTDKGYGTLVVYNNTYNGTSGDMQVWIWQVAYGTDGQTVAWRSRINAQNWTGWRVFMDSVDKASLNSSVAALQTTTSGHATTLDNHTETIKSHADSINNLNGSVGNLLTYQAKEYSWIAKATCSTWSRLCYIAYQQGVIGSSFLINVSATRANVVYNELFSVSVNHSKYASISKLSTGKYSTISIRCTVNSNGSAYVELYDNANNCTNSTVQNVYCRLIAVRCGEVEPYTSFADGTTLADGFSVGASMTIDKHDLQSTNGIANADYASNAGKVNGYTITAGTTDLVAGSSQLATGTIYIVYE